MITNSAFGISLNLIISLGASKFQHHLQCYDRRLSPESDHGLIYNSEILILDWVVSGLGNLSVSGCCQTQWRDVIV